MLQCRSVKQSRNFLLLLCIQCSGSAKDLSSALSHGTRCVCDLIQACRLRGVDPPRGPELFRLGHAEASFVLQDFKNNNSKNTMNVNSLCCTCARNPRRISCPVRLDGSRLSQVVWSLWSCAMRIKLWRPTQKSVKGCKSGFFELRLTVQGSDAARLCDFFPVATADSY